MSNTEKNVIKNGGMLIRNRSNHHNTVAYNKFNYKTLNDVRYVYRNNTNLSKVIFKYQKSHFFVIKYSSNNFLSNIYVLDYHTILK